MRKRTLGILIVLIILLLGIAGVYVGIGMHYQTHFFEHVKINGIDVSDLTAEEAEKLIAQQAEDYRIMVTTRGGAVEVIEGADIGYRFVSGGEVQAFLDQQNIFAWLPAYLGESTEYSMEASVTYDKEKLSRAQAGLQCMQADKVTSPSDASLTQQADGTYVIVPETEGNELDAEKVSALLIETVKNGGTKVDFETADCYLKPKVYADDQGLQAEAAVRNRYQTMTVTYQMGGDMTEILDGATISGWMTLDDGGQPVFDREAVTAWVSQLADAYDTIGTWEPFVTSNGDTVSVEAVTYGWQMDRDSEAEALYQLLLAGESTERSPVYFETAWTRGENDIGNTYVEIDYTNQRMWYYKDGVLLVETPVVTGNVSAGMASPEGIYCLVGKEENATLVGEDYKTPVDYWMPFYGGVGIHDADSWRTAYGGDIYQWSGSHGCINTPTAQAAVIFQNIDVGTPIICYSSGINYGYGQSGSGGSTANTGNGDIGIVDAPDGNASDGTVSDITVPETDSVVDITVPEENGAGTSSFDPEITLPDEPVIMEGDWADETLFPQEQVIN